MGQPSWLRLFTRGCLLRSDPVLGLSKSLAWRELHLGRDIDRMAFTADPHPHSSRVSHLVLNSRWFPSPTFSHSHSPRLLSPWRTSATRYLSTSAVPISVPPNSDRVYPHLPQIEIRRNVKLSLSIDDVVNSTPAIFQHQLRWILDNASANPAREFYTQAREADLQALRVLRSQIRVLEQEEKGCDERHFTIPGIHQDHRLQLCDGSISSAKVVLILHWPSLHDDSSILTPKAFTTLLLRQFNLLPPEESGLHQLAAINLFGVQSSPSWKGEISNDVLCPAVNGLHIPYPTSCIAHFKANRLGMIIDSIKAGKGQIFALFGKSWNDQLVQDVMSNLHDSYKRVRLSVTIPLLLDWEMGIEGVDLSVVKRALVKRQRVSADEYIISDPKSYVGMEERLAHQGSDRPRTEIRIDLVTQNGTIKAVFLLPPHPSSSGYSDSKGGRSSAHSLDTTCHFLSQILHGDTASSNTSIPFPHSTVYAMHVYDKFFQRVDALNTHSTTYKLKLLEHLHSEQNLTQTSVDLTSLPQCIRNDIFSIGTHALCMGAKNHASPEQTVLTSLLARYHSPWTPRGDKALPEKTTNPVVPIISTATGTSSVPSTFTSPAKNNTAKTHPAESSTPTAKGSGHVTQPYPRSIRVDSQIQPVRLSDADYRDLFRH